MTAGLLAATYAASLIDFEISRHYSHPTMQGWL